MLRKLVPAFLLALAACASSTKPGAVNVDRPQLLIAPTASLNKQASQLYEQQLSTHRASGKLNADGADAERVRVVSNRLIAQVGVFRSDAKSWPWEVNLFDDDIVNATCLPGGKISVYAGLIHQLTLTDDELAAAIGHEISHALREHAREKVSQQQLASAVVQGIANSRGRYAAAGSATADLGSKLFVMLPYSRQMESEADVMGLELMTRAGYNPEAAVSLQRKMLVNSGAAGRSDFFKTHPSGEFRIIALQAALPSMAPLGASVNTTFARSSATSGVRVSTPLLIPVRLGGIEFPTALPAGTKPEVPLGRESFQVERLARRAICAKDPVGALAEKGAGYELYSVSCDDGTKLTYRCEFGQCAGQS